MNRLRLLAAAAALLAAMVAQAQVSAVSRYRVEQLPIPGTVLAGCVPGYASGASIARINDFGVVNGTHNCFSVVDPVVAQLAYQSISFVAAPRFGAVELPRSGTVASYSYGINNRGELFGYEFGTPEGGGFFATKWSLAGGRERKIGRASCRERV